MLSYISSTFFLVLFFRTGRKKLKTLGLKLPFEVTESTSLHLMGLVDQRSNGHVNACICTMKSQYKATFNSQKNNKPLSQIKQYCTLSKEEKNSRDKVFRGESTVFKLISIFHLK